LVQALRLLYCTQLRTAINSQCDTLASLPLGCRIYKSIIRSYAFKYSTLVETKSERFTRPETKPRKSSQDEELKADIWEASAVEESAVEELEDVPVDRNQAESAISAGSVLNPQPELYIQVLAVLDGLGKREARKLMGGLKLQQKRNGVELSTELMVASIRLQFKADPGFLVN